MQRVCVSTCLVFYFLPVPHSFIVPPIFVILQVAPFSESLNCIMLYQLYPVLHGGHVTPTAAELQLVASSSQETKTCSRRVIQNEERCLAELDYPLLYLGVYKETSQRSPGRRKKRPKPIGHGLEVSLLNYKHPLQLLRLGMGP